MYFGTPCSVYPYTRYTQDNYLKLYLLHESYNLHQLFKHFCIRSPSPPFLYAHILIFFPLLLPSEPPPLPYPFDLKLFYPSHEYFSSLPLSFHYSFSHSHSPFFPSTSLSQSPPILPLLLSPLKSNPPLCFYFLLPPPPTKTHMKNASSEL